MAAFTSEKHPMNRDGPSSLFGHFSLHEHTRDPKISREKSLFARPFVFIPSRAMLFPWKSFDFLASQKSPAPQAPLFFGAFLDTTSAAAAAAAAVGGQPEAKKNPRRMLDRRVSSFWSHFFAARRRWVGRSVGGRERGGGSGGERMGPEGRTVRGEKKW